MKVGSVSLSAAVALVSLVVGLRFAFAQATAEHSREVRFDALKLSYDDLMALTAEIRKFCGFDPANTKIEESLEVTDGEQTFRLSRGFSRSDLKDAPDFANAVTYRLSTPENKVTKVALLFGHAYRKLEASGSDAGQIDALSALVKLRLEKNMPFWGSAICILLIAIPCSALGGASLVWAFVLETSTKRSFALLMLGFSSLLFAVVAFTGMTRFSVYQGDPSAINRWANTNTFIGMVTGLIALIVPAVFWLGKRFGNARPK